MWTARKTLELPPWVGDLVARWTGPLDSDEDRMALAAALAGENVARGTGGPFAALVWDPEAGRIVAAGVNLVVGQRASLAHAEVVALLLAEEALGTHDLGPGSLELITTSQPCLQCYGSIIWSGIRRVVVGARGADVEALAGFDEGPVPGDWQAQWASRGIASTTDVLRAENCRVLEAYRRSGAPVYNSQTNQLATKQPTEVAV